MDKWDKLKNWIKGYKEVVEMQLDTSEGADLFEKHTLIILDDITGVMEEMEDGKYERY